MANELVQSKALFFFYAAILGEMNFMFTLKQYS